MSTVNIDVRLAERPPGSVEPARYAPGQPMNVVVTVDVTAPTRCSGLDLVTRLRGEGKGFGPNVEGSRERLFEGEWAPGRYTYERVVAAPAGPPTFHGSWIKADWSIEATAPDPWAHAASAPEPFVVATPPMTSVDLVLPPPEHAVELASIAAARLGEEKKSKKAVGTLHVIGVLGILAFAAGATIRFGELSPAGLAEPLMGLGGFVGGCYVLLQVLSLVSSRLEDTDAPLDVAVALERIAPGAPHRTAPDATDVLRVVASVDPAATVEQLTAHLVVKEHTEWHRSAAVQDDTSKETFTLAHTKVTRPMAAGAEPGQWIADLPLAPELPCTVTDLEGHGLVWEVEIEAVHSGGKKLPAPVVRPLEAGPRVG